MSPERLKRILCAVLLGTVFAIAIVSVKGNEASSVFLRGDFPAFWAAGKIVRTSPSKLYDITEQARVQNEAWPEGLEQGVLSFSYPPSVALLLAPLSYLSPEMSKHLYSILLIALVFFSFFLLRSQLTEFSWSWRSILFLLLPTTTIAVISGQNLSFSILCLSWFWSSLGRGNGEEKPLQGGFALGLWLFKPHFSFIAFLLTLVSFKNVRAKLCIGYGFGAVLHYIVSSIAVRSLLWPVEFLSHAVKFSALDRQYNGSRMLSLPALIQYTLGLESDYSLWISLFLVLSAALLFVRSREKSNQELVPLIPPLVVLLSPHTMFYDMTIAFLPYLLLKDITKESRLLFLLSSYGGVLLTLFYFPESIGSVCTVFSTGIVLLVFKDIVIPKSPFVFISVFGITILSTGSGPPGGSTNSYPQKKHCQTEGLSRKT